jgi:hypothetical protein
MNSATTVQLQVAYIQSRVPHVDGVLAVLLSRSSDSAHRQRLCNWPDSSRSYVYFRSGPAITSVEPSALQTCCYCYDGTRLCLCGTGSEYGTASELY